MRISLTAGATGPESQREEWNVDVRRIFVSGIVASLVLAMWQMLVEAVIPDGTGFLGPPIAIGATVVRDLQGAANPLPFDALALVLGLAGHMMNSVVLGAAFGLVAVRLQASAAGTIGLGVAWGAMVFAAMWLVLLPLVNPLMLNLHGPAFLAAHLMWGAALGVAWARLGTRALAPAR